MLGRCGERAGASGWGVGLWVNGGERGEVVCNEASGTLLGGKNWGGGERTNRQEKKKLQCFNRSRLLYFCFVFIFFHNSPTTAMRRDKMAAAGAAPPRAAGTGRGRAAGGLWRSYNGAGGRGRLLLFEGQPGRGEGRRGGCGA